MQREEDAVERSFRHSPPQPVANYPGQILDRLCGHEAGRSRPDGQERYEVESLRRCPGDKASELGIRSPRGFDNVLATMNPGRGKGGEIRLDRGKDVGLMRDLGRGDAKGHRL